MKKIIRTVSSSSFITVNKRRFSLPSIFRGQRVEVIPLDHDRYLLKLPQYCRIVNSKYSKFFLEDYQYCDGRDELEKKLLISALIGPHTRILSLWFARSKPHIILSFQIINGVHYLADKYGTSIVEDASEYHVEVGISSYYLLKKKIIELACRN